MPTMFPGFLGFSAPVSVTPAPAVIAVHTANVAFRVSGHIRVPWCSSSAQTTVDVCIFLWICRYAVNLCVESPSRLQRNWNRQRREKERESGRVHRASACRVMRGTRVPIWKIEGSIEADYQASLETAQNPDGEPYPAFANDKSWDETSGKPGLGKKFCHSVILGTDSTAQPSIAAIITPVIHLCVTVWKLMKIRQTWDQIRSQFLSLYTADELLKAFTGTTDWVANLFWIAWSSVA